MIFFLPAKFNVNSMNCSNSYVIEKHVVEEALSELIHRTSVMFTILHLFFDHSYATLRNLKQMPENE